MQAVRSVAACFLAVFTHTQTRSSLWFASLLPFPHGLVTCFLIPHVKGESWPQYSIM